MVGLGIGPGWDGGGLGRPAAKAAAGSCTIAESFTAGTLVLLASGKAVPISSLGKGEKVRAVDTRTGKVQVKTAEAVLVHYDTRPV